MPELHYPYGSGSCPHPDCVAKCDNPTSSTLVFAFGRNPSTDSELDHFLDIYTPTGIASTFEKAKAEMIRYFRYWNSTADGELPDEDDEDAKIQRDADLADDYAELEAFKIQIEEMFFIGDVSGGACATFVDDHGDHWWVETYEVDKHPEWERDV